MYSNQVVLITGSRSALADHSPMQQLAHLLESFRVAGHIKFLKGEAVASV